MMNISYLGPPARRATARSMPASTSPGSSPAADRAQLIHVPYSSQLAPFTVCRSFQDKQFKKEGAR